MFSNRVANIGPGETIVVRLEYVQAVAYRPEQFSLRFPMTITPRYMPGRILGESDGAHITELEAQSRGTQSLAVSAREPEQDAPSLQVNPYLGWASPTDLVPDADAISPRLNPGQGSDSNPINPIEVTATLDMGMPLASVESPYHDITLARRAGVYHIDLAGGQSEMNRDFVLNWRPVSGSVPQAALFSEQVGDQHYGLLMVVPPGARRITEAVPRELVFVVDTSGSMGGVSIEQARASVAQALRQLRPQDQFNIIEFDSNFSKLYQKSMPATRHYVQQGLEFVRQLDASGGTEMLPALRAALSPGLRLTSSTFENSWHETAEVSPSEQPKGRLRQVIFITDGAVGNEAALFKEISEQLGNSRLFTVGIGSAPNSWFMRKAAEFGRGTHTHIGDLNEVGNKMAALFEQLARPAAVDFKIHWPVAVEPWPARVPDLYLGQPLSVAVNFGKQPPTGEVRISALVDGKPWETRIALTQGADPQAIAGHPGVASLWARFKIAGLLDEKVTGREEAAVRADVLPIALQHQLLSPYTSFVAVEEVISRPPNEALGKASVANNRPQGQSPQSFAYPATATTGPAKVWFGLLSLFCALLIRLLRQPEVDHAGKS